MRITICGWLMAAFAATASAQTLTIVPEKVLYSDMEIANTGPFVSKAGAGSGVVWSHTVTHPTGVQSVRIHVQLRQTRPSAGWRVVFRDLSGQVVETFEGGSPFLAADGVWSRDIRGRGGEVQLVTDTNAQGLEIAIDKYAFQIVEPIPMSIVGLDQRIGIRAAPKNVRTWGVPIAKLRFVRGNRQFVCTGFLVTAELLMTNEHCLGTPEIARSAFADFGFDDLASDPIVVRVARLEAVDAALDYAVVRLAQPQAKFGRATIGNGVVNDGQPLVIVQHPAGEHKQASIDDCVVRGASTSGVTFEPTDFGHRCDTLGGSSGSPVMDRQTGAVLGLHHFGFLEGSTDPVNQGVHINRILADLQTRFPKLLAELTAP